MIYTPSLVWNVCVHAHVHVHDMEINGFIVCAATVLGPIDPSQLGRTMSHDHILVDGSQFYTLPEYTSHDMAELDFDLCHLGKIRQYP